MIRYLVDSSGLWRLLRIDSLRAGWAEVVAAGAVGSCAAQRTEFRRSARNADEFDDMGEMFDHLYPSVADPKRVWHWVEAAQWRLARQGQARALSTVDLLICATAAHHHLVVLHDDQDFVTAAQDLKDVAQRSVRDLPS